jgi:hypothetical protein
MSKLLQNVLPTEVMFAGSLVATEARPQGLSYMLDGGLATYAKIVEAYEAA